MALALTRNLRVHSDVALTMIKAEVGVWRESEIPRAVRDLQVFDIAVRTKAREFRAFAETNRRGCWARAAGGFTHRADGTSTMTVRIGCPLKKLLAGRIDAAVSGVLVAERPAVGVPHRLVSPAGQGHATWNTVPRLETEMTQFLNRCLIS